MDIFVVYYFYNKTYHFIFKKIKRSHLNYTNFYLEVDFMIFNYIERSINRKIYLINLIYCTKNQTLETLGIRLNCSSLTVLSDIEYLNDSLNIPITKCEDDTYTLLPEKDASLQTYVKSIYQTSLFLQFLKYFLLTDKQSFKDFVQEQHVSIAKGYRLREDVIKFLRSINLDVQGNTVSGRILWIRFLAAELTRSFGMEVLTPSPEVEKRCNLVLDEMEDYINIVFSQQERELYTLLISASLTQSIPNNYVALTIPDCRLINSTLYPLAYKDSVKKHLMDFWNPEAQIAELNFSIVAFIVANSHLFDKSVDPIQAKHYREAFLNLVEVHSLIEAIESNFTVHPQMTNYFYTAVFAFLCDAMFRLQPLFTYPTYDDKQFYQTHIFQKMSDIIDEWNIYHIDIEKYRIADLCGRLTPILIPDLYENVVIVTDHSIDGNFLRDYLLTINPHYQISVQKQLNTLNEIEDNSRTLFILDKDLSKPFKLKPSMDNVIFIFFPLNEHALLELLTKLFK